MKFNKIAIIGSGLMGSSLYKALKANNLAKEIVMLARSIESVKKLKEIEINATIDFKKVSDSEIIVICTPLDSYQEVFSKLKGFEGIVTDIGSVKSKIENLQKTKFPELKFISSHPIAGSDISGTGSFVEDLYQGKKVIITSDSRIEGAEIIKEFWESVGMEVEFLGSRTHDRIYACVSHLPQLIGFALNGVGSLGDEILKQVQDDSGVVQDDREVVQDDSNNDCHPELVSGSHPSNSILKNFFRLSNSNPKIWAEIFEHNKENLETVRQAFLAELKENKKFLIESRQEDLLQKFAMANKKFPGQNHDLIVEDEIFLAFGQIIAISLINSIKDLSFFTYVGSGFKDLVEIKNINLNFTEILKNKEKPSKVVKLVDNFITKFGK